MSVPAAAGIGAAPLPNGLVVVEVVVVPDVLVVVAAGFAPKREGVLVAGAAVLDDAAGAVVVAAGNKEGAEAGAEAAAGAVVVAVDAGVENNDGLDGAAEEARPEPPRLEKRDGGAAAAVVVAAVLAGVVAVVVEAGFALNRVLLLLPPLSAGLAEEAAAPKRDGVGVPPVEAANGLGFSVAPVEAGLAPNRDGVPELLAAGCDAGVEADPPLKRLELGCGVAPVAPPKRLLGCDPWPPACWPKRLGVVALAESVGGAPAGVVDPRPPNIGFVGVACPAEANKELPVPALVDGVELAAGFAPPNRGPEDAAPNGLAVEPAPAAVVGVLEGPPNRLDGDAAGLFCAENSEFAPPAGGVPVDAAPPNNEGEDEDALVEEAPPNREPPGFEALFPKRPPAGAAGCPGVAALSFCALPKEKPLDGVEDWLPNSEGAAVDEVDAPDVA